MVCPVLCLFYSMYFDNLICDGKVNLIFEGLCHLVILRNIYPKWPVPKIIYNEHFKVEAVVVLHMMPII